MKQPILDFSEVLKAKMTYDKDAHTYYFKPSMCLGPPYLKQLHVEAIVDVAEDGTLGGVEIIDRKMPKPYSGGAEKPTMWNPFDAVIAAALKLYPSLDCLVEWEEESDGTAPGSTTFPTDGSKPIVRVSIGIPVLDAVDVLAHELTHVIIGPDCGDAHGPEWQEIFDKIREQYLKDNGGEKDV